MFSRPITLTTVTPPHSLIQYVQSFWIATDNGQSGSGGVFRPITDGYPGLLMPIVQNNPFYDQERKRLPTICLYGQTIKAREIHAYGRFEAVGVSLQPWAIPSLFGFGANELTDTCVDLSAVLSTSRLEEQLANAPAPMHQLDRLATYLQTCIAKSTPPDHQVSGALHELLRTNGNRPLHELRQQLNLSERGLERKFRRSVGVSPKLFARICQFQASLTQLHAQGYDRLSDIAFDNGYADQSHFIRTFRAFTGCTPDRYRKQLTDCPA